MNAPSTPLTLSWPFAMLRALLPQRLVLCGAMLLLSATLLDLANWYFAAADLDLASWWSHPLNHIHAILIGLFGQGSGSSLLRLLILWPFLTLLWCIPGAWIAWQEYHAQDTFPASLSPVAFLRQRWTAIYAPMLFLWSFVCFLVLTSWLGSGMQYLVGWGIGSLLYALLLPLFLVLHLVAILSTVAFLAVSLMPACAAAEGRDGFEVLSRCCSYQFQRPMGFACWWGLSFFLALLPIALAVGLVSGEQPPIPAQAHGPTLLLGLVLGASLFWSLQPLVYLKLRRLVDSTAETILWNGPEEEGITPGSRQDATPERAEPAEGVSEIATTADAQLIPQRQVFTLADTVNLGNASHPATLFTLLSGVFWLWLMFAGGLWVGAQIENLGPMELNSTGVHGLISILQQQRPFLLTSLLAAVVLLGSWGLGRPLRMAGRFTAIRALYSQDITLAPQAISYARRTVKHGLAGVLAVTTATVLVMYSLYFAPIALADFGQTIKLVVLLGFSLVLGGAGTLSLGAVAVEGNRLGDPSLSPVSAFLGNVGSVGLSALAALLVGSIRFTAQALLATLAWVLTCTSLTWFRGADADWIRWGLDGHFTPTTEGPLAWLASRIAGLWFFLLFGATLVYPLSYLTRWGVVTYLWCRPTPRLGGADAVDLSDEERTDLLDQQIARQRKKKR